MMPLKHRIGRGRKINIYSKSAVNKSSSLASVKNCQISYIKISYPLLVGLLKFTLSDDLVFAAKTICHLIKIY